MIEEYHIPVLLKESIDGLNINPNGIYVDVTFGGGGHSKEILKRLSSKGRIYSFDQDIDAYNNNKIKDSRFTFIRGNFRYIKNFLNYYNVQKIDGLLADLGVSSHHFDEKDRGFSFRFEGELDMRMNQKSTKTAAYILNNASEEELLYIFKTYGELIQSKKIASEICKFRNIEKIKTISDFLKILEPFLRKDKEKKIMSQAFQALRIKVNEEIDALSEMILKSYDILKIGGRLSVISYHSIEDRLIKKIFKTGNLEGNLNKDFWGNVETPFKQITKKVIIPSIEEQKANPRSRSAKLRIVEKVY